MKIHHIGIVVNNIVDSLGELSKFINFEETTIPSLVDSQKVKICFLKLGEFRLELIEPISQKSPVLNFLNTGGGFHHICFEVDDLENSINHFVNNKARLIVKPTIGFENNKIAFLLLNMKKTNFNLIELVEIKND